ncbi:cytochrome-c oxidase, cbb3-type subunit III [Thiomicrospira microaerophila]|uniref:cytochrome-c oxidase, cbb3-type subunit III n=1 Tax=Thiomicrospira microaerophila TaxID=406020 RepID=UPI0020102ED8|nr:cytochrome-c oxidase, cbb3-type subunit III [Thiomicrospira microaerophila]UQB42058.1 cytochrome-c oxidase, cbb3-type subunit III [Thiomicrospira microaerophila]
MAQHNPWPDEGNTGHIWDEDIRELDNPPPLWWMLAFYAGFVMIIFYALYYPAIPLADSHTKGLAGWTAIEEYKESKGQLEAWRQRTFAAEEEQLRTLDVTEILADDNLRAYAVNTSKVLFGDYCMACHGWGGAGNPNFPILANDDWQWGGTVKQIEAAMINGRVGNMPARGMMGNLTDEQVVQVAEYSLALSTGDGDNPEFAAGKAIYNGAGMCMACHGPTGKPLAPNGASNLADGIFRFQGVPGNLQASTLESYIYTIKYGVGQQQVAGTREAVMPSFKERLPDAEVNIKRLAVYVHQLGGGQ